MCKKKVVEYYRNIVELNSETVINGSGNPLSIKFKFNPNKNTYMKGDWEVFLESFNMAFEVGSQVETSLDLGVNEYKVGLNINLPYKYKDYKLNYSGFTISAIYPEIPDNYLVSNSLKEMNIEHIGNFGGNEIFGLNHNYFPINEGDIGRRLCNSDILSLSSGNSSYDLSLTSTKNILASQVSGNVGKLSKCGFTLLFRHIYYEEDNGESM